VQHAEREQPMSRKTPQNEIQEHVQSAVGEARQEVESVRQPWYHLSKVAGILLIAYAIQLALFGLLAWWVHSNPVNPIDVAITRELQENPAPWLRVFMLAVSYPGYMPYQPILVALATLIFWFVGLRLEAVFIAGLSLVNLCVNLLVKFLVARPRPNGHLIDIFSPSSGNSFPSGHVMAYLAFWGLLFSFSIILFNKWRWWRILLMVVSALMVVLIGPSRIYLGDHWASDVLGAYLIGGVLLGISLWIYLRLKQRGVLEKKGEKNSSVLHSFSRK